MNLDMLVQRSVMLLQANAPANGVPYYGAFSGGKDSTVIKELARMAEVPVSWRYNVTTIDPPELIAFMREHHRDVEWVYNEHGHMLNRAVETKGFPTKRSRWCCKSYKEGHEPAGSTTIIGVRIAESLRRKQKWTNCTSYRDDKRGGEGRKLVLPIRLWSDADVWAFIKQRKLPYCSLYDEGFRRLGCVGCPLITPKQRRHEFERWPKYGAAWRRMFERLWAKRAGQPDRNGNEWWGSRVHDSVDELWEWWMDGQQNATKWRRGKGLRVKG